MSYSAPARETRKLTKRQRRQLRHYGYYRERSQVSLTVTTKEIATIKNVMATVSGEPAPLLIYEGHGGQAVS